ncbi:hypothetical protein [Bacillus thuringiensis]|uniref:hypothetical protein n=2 Tax=Bacillaceae TaxID=186817 RepID=UPI003F5237AE
MKPTSKSNEKEGAIQMCKKHKKTWDKVTNIFCDGGYTGPLFAQSIKETIGTSQICRVTETLDYGTNFCLVRKLPQTV